LDSVDFGYIASGSVTFAEFCTTMQIGAKDNKAIGQSLKSLINFSIGIESVKSQDYMTVFRNFKIEDASIYYCFSEYFLQMFTGICKDYFRLEVPEVIGLHSSHAIRVYQLMKSKLNMTDNEFDYTLEEFKKCLNIEDKYTRYNDLKKRVLDVCKTQINQSAASKFSLDYKAIKVGNGVKSVKLIIQDKEENYYVEKNLVAGYKIDQIKKNLTQLLRHESSVVRLLAEKIRQELKYKKPSRAVIANYLDAIKKIAEHPVPEL